MCESSEVKPELVFMFERWRHLRLGKKLVIYSPVRGSSTNFPFPSSCELDCQIHHANCFVNLRQKTRLILGQTSHMYVFHKVNLHLVCTGRCVHANHALAFCICRPADNLRTKCLHN